MFFLVRLYVLSKLVRLSDSCSMLIVDKTGGLAFRGYRWLVLGLGHLKKSK